MSRDATENACALEHALLAPHLTRGLWRRQGRWVLDDKGAKVAAWEESWDDGAFIAAANPATIEALLRERQMLRDQLHRAVVMLRDLEAGFPWNELSEDLETVVKDAIALKVPLFDADQVLP